MLNMGVSENEVYRPHDLSHNFLWNDHPMDLGVPYFGTNPKFLDKAHAAWRTCDPFAEKSRVAPVQQRGGGSS